MYLTYQLSEDHKEMTFLTSNGADELLSAIYLDTSLFPLTFTLGEPLTGNCVVPDFSNFDITSVFK